ncbi:MAG: hypothetical protein RRZ66_07385, partial [Bacteroidales bacterium]
MKKNLLKLSALFVGGLFMFACSSDEKTVQTEDQSMELSFNVSFNDLTRAAVDANDDGTNQPCVDPEDFDATQYTALITIKTNGTTPVQYEKKIRSVGGKFVTDPISLTKPVGAPHTLSQMLIVDNNQNANVHWSSVEDTNPDGKYEFAVPQEHKTPREIKWDGANMEIMKKKVMDMTLLCAVNDKPSDFGYGQWGLDLVKVICLNYSVNVCGDPCDASVDPKHEIGETQITVIKENKVGNEWVYANKFTSSSAEEKIGEICVNDQLSVADEDERFTITITVQGYGSIMAQVTGDQLFENYMNSGFWEKPQGQENGYLHFDLCDLDWTKVNTPVTPIQANATNPWNFIVSVPKICDRVCDPDCGDIFANWVNGEFGECGSQCHWETYCGCFVKDIYEGKTSLLSKPIFKTTLVTPGTMLKAGDKVKVTYIAAEKDLLVLTLIPRPTQPAVVTPAPATKMFDYNTYTAEVTVNEDGCYALQMVVDPYYCLIFPAKLRI